jgi:hypothetical protein
MLSNIKHLLVTPFNTMGFTCWARNAYPSGTHEYTSGFQSESCCLILSFLCNVLYIIVCTFSVGHCNECPPSIYGFWKVCTNFKKCKNRIYAVSMSLLIKYKLIVDIEINYSTINVDTGRHLCIRYIFS